MVTDKEDRPPILLSTASFALQGSARNPALAMEPVKLSGVRFDGIDLYITGDENAALPALPSPFVDWLLSFPIVTIHTSFLHIQKNGCLDLNRLKRVLDVLSGLCVQVNACALVVHTDCLETDAARILGIIREKIPTPIWLEMMGRDKRYGNRLEHIKALLLSHRALGVVPDLAHLDEMDDVPPTTIFRDKHLKDSIRMVHCSITGTRVPRFVQKHWYSRDDINHVPAVVRPESINPELAHCAIKYPLVMEGAIPSGEKGLKILAAEAAWWKTLQSKK